MAIWICPHCNEVYDANEFDEDWVTIGCPACIGGATTFSTENERTNGTYIGTLQGAELLPGDTVTARGQYRLDSLEEFAVNIVAEDELVWQFANDTPCEITYERDGVSVQHILAPRIESK